MANHHKKCYLKNHFADLAKYFIAYFLFLKKITFKKVVAFVFFLALIMPSFLTYVFYRYNTISTREDVAVKIEEGIEENELVYLKFARNEIETLLRWEHSREFEFDNQMYDIVEIEEHGDSVFYWAWWDKAETKLKKDFQDSLTDLFDLNSNKPNKSSIKHHFKNITVFNNSQRFSFYTKELNALFANHSGELMEGYQSPTHHPPKAC